MRADEFIQDIHRNFDQLTLLEPEQASVLEDEFPLRCRGDGIAQVADLRTHVLKPAGGWSFFRVNPAAVKVIVHGDSWAIPRWRRVRFNTANPGGSSCRLRHHCGRILMRHRFAAWQGRPMTAPQARRLLALAAIYDGATRTEA